MLITLHVKVFGIGKHSLSHSVSLQQVLAQVSLDGEADVTGAQVALERPNPGFAGMVFPEMASRV